MISHTKTTKDFFDERDTELRIGKVSVMNLGCARNLVDSQAMLGTLKRKGHRIVDLDHAESVIVNTCSFIEDAKKESIDTILDLIELKRQGKLKKVIVAGCLAQRYADEIRNEIEGIDAIVGVQQISQTGMMEQISLTPKHYAYVKICESCYNSCSFCIIPKIKGKFISRTIESIIEEIRLLDQRGVKEINLIGQDITAYGMDLYHRLSLAELIKKIIPVTKNIQWIRLLYTFPAHVTDELIDVMAQEKKVCDYIDMPLQHISDHLLRDMNRNITTQQTRELIHKIKSHMPHASLRTTFIVGLPGETKEDFNELMEFIEETRFEKVGAFIYSREEGTKAYAFDSQVDDTIKRERLNRLMQAQKKISNSIQSQYLNQTIKVMIDEKSKEEENIFLGRSEYDAPEVDGIVYVHSSKKLIQGDLIDVRITDSLEYDLVGEAA